MRAETLPRCLDVVDADLLMHSNYMTRPIGANKPHEQNSARRIVALEVRRESQFRRIAEMVVAMTAATVRWGVLLLGTIRSVLAERGGCDDG